MAKNTLILDGAYEVLGLTPGPVGYKGGEVDLSVITVAQAEKLVKQGFPYLRKVEAAGKKAAEAEKGK
jgi:hypothetical protein